MCFTWTMNAYCGRPRWRSASEAGRTGPHYGLWRPPRGAPPTRARPDGQPMMSDGILTGRDHGDTTLDPRMSLAELAAEIEWLELPDALAWFRAMAEQPAVTSTLRGETIVHARWAEFLRNLEGGPVYRPADDDGLVRRM